MPPGFLFFLDMLLAGETQGLKEDRAPPCPPSPVMHIPAEGVAVTSDFQKPPGEGSPA